MTSVEKVKNLSEVASFDMESCQSSTFLSLGKTQLPIYKASSPRGSCKLFKTLLTNKCKMDCKYCINSKCSTRRQPHKYEKGELARTFHFFYKKRLVDALFLSSSIEEPETNMEEMIEEVKTLREDFRFRGYIHLKILPGSSRDQVQRAAIYADRLSINIETISPSHLAELSSTKDMKNDILLRQAWIREEVRKRAGLNELTAASDDAPQRLPGSQLTHTTQLIVGALGETDREVFGCAISEYSHMEVKRVYYSPFSPIPGTPLESHSPAGKWRGHRLYQLDFLYRDYDFKKEEIDLAYRNDFLPNEDPKVTIARSQLAKPQEINGLGKEELLRIPGVGPKTAERIASHKEKLSSMLQLHKLGVNLSKALPFIKIDGSYQERISAFCA